MIDFSKVKAPPAFEHYRLLMDFVDGLGLILGTPDLGVARRIARQFDHEGASYEIRRYVGDEGLEQVEASEDWKVL